MKGKCKHAIEKGDIETWCKLNHQYIAGTTCELCDDYEEEE